jgi:dTDP-glucose pyrophosphorylase
MSDLDIYISPTVTIRNALKKMDQLQRKLLIVTYENKFVSLLSIGDIQRAIINNKSLETIISEVLRENVRVAKSDTSFYEIKKMMFDFRMEFCPVVNSELEIEKIYFWEDVFLEKKPIPFKKFNLPVIIMAGGMGSRLKPLTSVLPKPLIPINNKSIIEEIFDKFSVYGCDSFYISVNYKAELIQYYLTNQNLPYQLSFIKETIPMGTAGGISLLKGKINSTFFVSNCDIIVDQDYSEMLDFHIEKKNEITLIAALKNYSIPYGTIISGENGQLIDIKEKPEYTFMINSGMYILEPHLIHEIPENSYFHITDLIDIVKKRNGNIGVYPVSEKSWKDIGEWHELYNNIKLNIV